MLQARQLGRGMPRSQLCHIYVSADLQLGKDELEDLLP